MNPILLCQHCGNRTSHTIIEKGEEIEEVEFEEGMKFDYVHYLWFTRCDNCSKHSLFYCMDDDPQESNCLWPNEKRISQAVPKDIRLAYEEALKVKKISKTAFVILIRRALEVLCKEEKVYGDNLAGKIKKLGDSGFIPQKLIDVADLIRLVGNDGAHSAESETTDYEINLIDEFYLAIIEYLYVAPEKVKSLKEKLLKGNK